MKFSANLGYLWADLALPNAIRAAKRAGFDAVECHFPYDQPAAEVKLALGETGLPMLGVNTAKGPHTGDFGLAAIVGRESEARMAVDQAFDYAHEIGAEAVHVMAGCAEGPAAEAAFIATLKYASDRAMDRMVLIEPLNAHDVPGYFLRDTGVAADIISRLGRSNVKLMFDCYHVARTEGDVAARFHALLPIIGHVQFAGVPHRGAPDRGDLDYRAVFGEIARTGWQRPLGAEYRPDGPVEAGLGWMKWDVT